MTPNTVPAKFRVNMADGTSGMICRGCMVACLFLENTNDHTQVKFKDGDSGNGLIILQQQNP